jgi:hypothetical protein
MEQRATMAHEQKKQEIKIHFPPEMIKGAYANNLLIRHSKDEFVMDFIMISPPAGTVTSRVIVSPGQAKRISMALQENVAKYEESHGEIKVGEVPKGNLDINLYTKQ